MGRKVFAFLDLLGFSARVKENPTAAENMMDSYNRILKIINTDQKIHPVESYPKSMQSLARDRYIDSFEYFLPGSDSIFISTSPDKINSFIPQLCSFIYKSFEYLSLMSIDNLTDYPPCLFRGGLSLGEVEPVQQSAIENGAFTDTRNNMIGAGVVDAVKLEGLVYGPRILLSDEVKGQLNDDIQSHYIRKVDESEFKEKPEKEFYELLWPVASFIRENGFRSEAGNLNEAIDRACRLYKIHDGDAKQHYQAFIDLLYNSILQYWDNDAEAQEFVCVSKKEMNAILKC